jgi:hypothetical protein
MQDRDTVFREECHECGSKNMEEAKAQAFVMEGPRREVVVDVNVGHCGDCGEFVYAKRPVPTIPAGGSDE